MSTHQNSPKPQIAVVTSSLKDNARKRSVELETIPSTPTLIKSCSQRANQGKLGLPKPRLDLFGQFKDDRLQLEYVLFCVRQRSRVPFILLGLLTIAWAIAETIAFSWFNFDGEIRTYEMIIGSINLFLLLIALCLGVQLAWGVTSSDENVGAQSSSSSKEKELKVQSSVQVAFIAILNLIFFLMIIGQMRNQDCIPDSLNLIPFLQSQLGSNFTDLLEDSLQSMTCTRAHQFSTISSQNTVILMSICPQLLMVILYEPRLYLLLMFHLATAVLLVVATMSAISLPIILVALVLVGLTVELHFQRTKSFLAQRELQEILKEREKTADAVHAMEMRHMIGNVAHDLKTPLASFTNGLDVIFEILQAMQEKMQVSNGVDGGLLTEGFLSIQTCLTNIRNTNAFMLMTINRCIDYTKASKGMKLVPKYETVDLREALQFPIECMSNIQERIGIKLEAMSEEICSHIITDKQWLQENLLCLLSNAVKYSAEGSVTIAVSLQPYSVEPIPESERSVSVKKSFISISKVAPMIVEEGEGSLNYCLMFEIEDNGIGLSDEAMKNLFNPFRQAQRLAGGTGLGLYSLAKRMEALRGSYGVRKRKDGKQGSLFWFAIPYKPDTISSASLHKSVSLRVQSGSERDKCAMLMSRMEILIVDDSPSILKMSSMMLKRQGHQIWTAENGEIALKRIEEKWRGSGKGFDLVLMDLQMPVMDGLEATRRLRAMEAEGREWMIREEESSSVHQLMFGVSANSDNETIYDALEAGFNDFLEKPFSMELFTKTVQKHSL